MYRMDRVVELQLLVAKHVMGWRNFDIAMDNV
jgi:hypothetical protein